MFHAENVIPTESETKALDHRPQPSINRGPIEYNLKLNNFGLSVLTECQIGYHNKFCFWTY